MKMLKIQNGLLRMSPNRLNFHNLPVLLVSENIDIPLQTLTKVITVFFWVGMKNHQKSGYILLPGLAMEIKRTCKQYGPVLPPFFRVTY